VQSSHSMLNWLVGAAGAVLVRFDQVCHSGHACGIVAAHMSKSGTEVIKHRVVACGGQGWEGGIAVAGPPPGWQHEEDEAAGCMLPQGVGGCAAFRYGRMMWVLGPATCTHACIVGCGARTACDRHDGVGRSGPHHGRAPCGQAQRGGRTQVVAGARVAGGDGAPGGGRTRSGHG
jgi:hypothetical protein